MNRYGLPTAKPMQFNICIRFGAAVNAKSAGAASQLQVSSSHRTDVSAQSERMVCA
jgi:hypothetical protein